MQPILLRPIAFDLRLRSGVFVLATAAVYAVTLTVLSALDAFGPDAIIMATAATLDLSVFVPVLFWMLVVRGGAPRLSVVPIAVVSLLITRRLVPSEYHQTVNALEMVVFPLELCVLAFIFWRVGRALRAGGDTTDPVERIRVASESLLGRGRAAEVIAFEATLLWLAVASWRLQPPQNRADEAFFTHHRKPLYGVAVAGILIAGFIELVGVHLLLERWNTTAAWIVSGLSLYGLLWLIGDYRAIVLRPSRLADGHFHLRLGLRRQASFRLDAIASCTKLSATERFAMRQRKDVMRATLLGEPSHLIELHKPIDVLCSYGIRRRTQRLALMLDQEDEFESMVAAQLGRELVG